MIEGNLGLVRFAVARFVPTAAIEREDYFQEGVLGLAAAVDRYDPDRTGYFSSFACRTSVARSSIWSRPAAATCGRRRPGRQGGSIVRSPAGRRSGCRPGHRKSPGRSKWMNARLSRAAPTAHRPASRRRTARQTSPTIPLQAPAMKGCRPWQECVHAPVGGRRALEAVHGDAGRTMGIAAELGLSPGGSAGSSSPVIVICDR